MAQRSATDPLTSASGVNLPATIERDLRELALPADLVEDARAFTRAACAERTQEAYREFGRGSRPGAARMAARQPCGAFARSTRKPCQGAPPVTAWRPRCKLHGGMSTGPRTEEGRRRRQEAMKERWLRKRGEQA